MSGNKISDTGESVTKLQQFLATAEPSVIKPKDQRARKMVEKTYINEKGYLGMLTQLQAIIMLYISTSLVPLFHYSVVINSDRTSRRSC
jgi:hypothetical protein